MPKAIIVGATSGIGRALANAMARQGYILGLTGRRVPLLKEIKAHFPRGVFIQPMDLRQTDRAVTQLQRLFRRMRGADILVLCAGISFRTPGWGQELETIRVNVIGFSALARVGLELFTQQGHGQLVGLSSISGLRGRNSALVYSATKAYVSNYLQGLRQRVYALGLSKKITITDIIPGFVDTPLIRGKQGHFWIAPVDTAARQILRALEKKKAQAYITRRWRLIAWALKLIPNAWHQRL